MLSSPYLVIWVTELSGRNLYFPTDSITDQDLLTWTRSEIDQKHLSVSHHSIYPAHKQEIWTKKHCFFCFLTISGPSLEGARLSRGPLRKRTSRFLHISIRSENQRLLNFKLTWKIVLFRLIRPNQGMKTTNYTKTIGTFLDKLSKQILSGSVRLYL